MGEDLIEQIFNLGGDALKQLGHIGGGVDDLIGKFNTLNKVGSMFNNIVLGAAIGFGIDQIIKLNKSLEETKMRLAGSIGAAGFTKSFNHSLELTNDLMKQNREEAAKLPGSEAQFMQGFSYTMPALKAAGMTDLSKMLTLSNNLMATSISQGIDSGQAARDVMQMAQGRAGMDVRSFVTFKDVMGVKTTDEFNQKSAAERIKLLEKVVKAYGGMLGEFDNTWEAISSTATSYAENTMRALTNPAFEEFKKGVKWLNDEFGSMQEKVILIAEHLGRGAAKAITSTVKYLKGQMVPGGATSDLGAGNGAMFGPFTQDRVTENSATNPIEATSWVGSFMEIMTGFGELGPVLDSTINFFRSLGYALLDIVEPLLPPLATGLHGVLSVVGLLWMGLMDFGALIFDTLGPVFRLLSTAVGFVAQVFMDSLLIGAKVLGGVYSWFAAKLGPLFQNSVNLISETADWLIKIIQKLGVAWNEIATQASEGAVSKTFGVDDLSAWIKGLSSKVGSNEQFGPPRPPEKLKPVVNQDFRGSKFNIEMAFAKEYDPDRIATAFKAEIPKKAALESGLTPLFALM